MELPSLLQSPPWARSFPCSAPIQKCPLPASKIPFCHTLSPHVAQCNIDLAGVGIGTSVGSLVHIIVLALLALELLQTCIASCLQHWRAGVGACTGTTYL